MYLTETEKALAQGQGGEAVRAALSILIEMGELFGAERLIPISQVHDDALLFIGPAIHEFVQKMVDLGGRVAVPTSLNPADYDLRNPEGLRVPPDKMADCRRLSQAHLDLGAAPTWTCTPYQTGFLPRFGQQIAWAESNATAFANSIIGARTNRYAGLLDVCAAIAGRAPLFGLHLTANRAARMLIRLDGFSREELTRDELYPLLGYVYGRLAGHTVAALEGLAGHNGDNDGLAGTIPIDSLKAFTAAAASSGSVGLFHLIGITPEAPDRAACFQGRKPAEERVITPADIDQARAELWTAQGDTVDLIALGCPHFSFMEFMALDRALGQRRVSENTACWVFTNRSVKAWLADSGLLDSLIGRGVAVFTDGCPLCYPHQEWGFSTAMTNSGKFATYGPAQTGHAIAIAGLAQCVESAVAGKIVLGGGRD